MDDSVLSAVSDQVIVHTHSSRELNYTTRSQIYLAGFMSSAEQATSSTSSTSNTRLIADAFEKYAKITGKDLSKNTFAAALEQSDSPEAILELLHEREKAFKEYREGNRRLINCLSPVVNVVQSFSDVLGEAVGLVSHAYIRSGDSF
jgi:hypothetical protein